MGPAYETGGVSAEMKLNAPTPPAVNGAGTNAATPSSGTTTCRSGLNSSRRFRRKKPTHARLHRMYTSTTTSTMIVATSRSAVCGS